MKEDVEEVKISSNLNLKVLLEEIERFDANNSKKQRNNVRRIEIFNEEELGKKIEESFSETVFQDFLSLSDDLNIEQFKDYINCNEIYQKNWKLYVDIKNLYQIKDKDTLEHKILEVLNELDELELKGKLWIEYKFPEYFIKKKEIKNINKEEETLQRKNSNATIFFTSFANKFKRNSSTFRRSLRNSIIGNSRKEETLNSIGIEETKLDISKIKGFNKLNEIFINYLKKERKYYLYSFLIELDNIENHYNNMEATDKEDEEIFLIKLNKFMEDYFINENNEKNLKEYVTNEKRKLIIDKIKKFCILELDINVSKVFSEVKEYIEKDLLQKLIEKFILTTEFEIFFKSNKKSFKSMNCNIKKYNSNSVPSSPKSPISRFSFSIQRFGSNSSKSNLSNLSNSPTSPKVTFVSSPISKYSLNDEEMLGNKIDENYDEVKSNNNIDLEISDVSSKNNELNSFEINKLTDNIDKKKGKSNIRISVEFGDNNNVNSNEEIVDIKEESINNNINETIKEDKENLILKQYFLKNRLINNFNYDISIIDNDYIYKIILQCILFNDLKGLKKIYNIKEKYKDFIYNINHQLSENEGMTFLHISVKNNLFDISKYLISKDANVNSTDKFSRTPLHISCSNSNNEITILLLSSGANLNLKDIYGYYPIHLSFLNFNQDLFKNLMLFQAEINSKKDDGSTILHEVSKNNPKALKFVLNYNNNEIFDEKKKLKLNQKDNLGIFIIFYKNIGNTPLFSAIIEGNSESIELLLNQKDIKVNNRNELDLNIYHVAALYDKSDVIELLSNNSKTEDLYNEITHNGSNALHFAVKSNSIMSVIKLIQLDNNGDTPLHLSIKKKKFRYQEYCYTQEQRLTFKIKIRKLLKKCLKFTLNNIFNINKLLYNIYHYIFNS